jgi:tocopherol cyclase
VSIPERKQNFCFMYSVENPAFPKKLTALESAQHGSRSIGVGAQILGAYDKYICQFSEESQDFWGSKCFPPLFVMLRELFEFIRFCV